MIVKANKIFGLIGISDIHVIVASSELIPFSENRFDLVVSNGVINLSPEKEKSFSEMKTGFIDISFHGETGI